MDISPAGQRNDPVTPPADGRGRAVGSRPPFSDALNRVQDRRAPDARKNPVRPLTPWPGQTVGRLEPDLDTRRAIEQSYLNQITRLAGARALQPSMTSVFPAAALHYAGQLSDQVFNAALTHQKAPGHTALPNHRERESAVPRVGSVDGSGEVTRL